MSAPSWPLTPTQQGMLFHRRLLGGEGGEGGQGDGVDIEQIVATLEDEALDPVAFAEAWHATIARHDALRARFVWPDGREPLQEIETAVEMPLTQLDWRDATEAEQASRLARWLADDRARNLALDRAPAMRLALIRCGERRWHVVWTVHHALCDGRSFALVLSEVFERYDAAREGLAYAGGQAGSLRGHLDRIAALDLAQAEAFWRERLDGLADPTPLPGAPQAAAGRGVVEQAASPALDAALRALAAEHDLNPATLVQGAFAALLARHAGSRDVLFGAVRSGRDGDALAATTVGCLINTLPLRVAVDDDAPVIDWLRALRQRERAVRPFGLTPLAQVQRWAPAGAVGGDARRLFDALLVYDHASLDAQMKAQGPAFARRHFELHERTHYPLTLYAWARPALTFRLAYDEPRLSAAAARRLVAGLLRWLEDLAARPQARLGELSVIGADDEAALRAFGHGPIVPVPSGCVHDAFAQQAARAPEAVALVAASGSLTYAELDARAERLAARLRAQGAAPGVPVGLCLSRDVALVVGVLAVLKAGAAYLPLDPAYPPERLAFMLTDSGAPLLLTERAHAGLLPATPCRALLVEDGSTDPSASAAAPVAPPATASDLAYVIYTSGSTGRPKGTMVEHRQVMNFFAAMDAALPPPAQSPGTWLAVTSLAFDISVLELLWTLTRGWRVVLQPQPASVGAADPVQAASARPIDMGLMFFSSADSVADENEKYRLLMNAARFADEHGFSSLWTPERHFHEFGGLFPNPSVIAAALAAVTKRIALRSGSVVAALHHPARIAEEWAVVDNLSGGRVGLSFAAGWQPRDFVLAPRALETAGAALRGTVDAVRRLWRGEALTFDGPQGRPTTVRTFPRPLQSELPVWLTAAGAPETFRTAGEIGAGVLTHLLGQTHEELAERIALYRRTWREAGHAGEGRVTLMLHTFVGDDTEAVRETVRAPLMRYLASSLQLVKGFTSAWSAFKKRADGSTAHSASVDIESLSAEEREGLLAFAFERYFETSGLFGDEARALATVERVRALGVDEIACLIDFGVEEARTLAHLRHLARVRERAQPAGGVPASVAGSIERHGVTHLQCTPSLAASLAAEPASLAALARLETLLLGGEALSPALAGTLRAAGVKQLLNMYGPTETTVWSACHGVEAVDAHGTAVPIGRPIANTTLHVLDAQGRPVPMGVAGELHIGGAGVVRGYLGQPALTAERFVPDPFDGGDGARLYRTGDLARWRDDGRLEFLGRMDQQVKIRGHRIELGEVEAALASHPAVREAVVVARDDLPGGPALVGYVIGASAGQAPDAQALRRHLRERLPEAMVPSHVVTLAEWPQTPNRKIDRRALPSPLAVAAAQPAGHAPADDAAAYGRQREIEGRIAAVWQQVLQLPRIEPEGNFFDLGGHSLLAVQAHRLLVQALEAPSLTITDLFRFPTVRALAAHVASAGGDSHAAADSSARVSRRREAMAARRALRPGPAGR